MQIRKLFSAALVVCACSGLAPAAMREYFVNGAAGSDENPGSRSKPWRTLAQVNRQELQAGDTVSFARGTSYDGSIQVSASGSAAAPIVFTAYGEGPAPRFSNPEFSDRQGHIFHIEGSYVVVERLFFVDTPTPPPENPPVPWRESAQHRNVTEMGAVFVARQASHVVVQDCEFVNTPVGIRLRGSHSAARRNYLRDAAKITEQWGAIAIVVVGPHNEVAYNRVVNYGYYGGNFGMDGAAIELDGEDRSFDAHDTHIHHNVSINNKGGFVEITGKTANVTIDHNLSDDIDKFVGVVGIKNLVVDANTIIRTRNANLRQIIFWTFNRKRDDGISISNNLFYLGSKVDVYAAAWRDWGIGAHPRRNNLYFFPDAGTDPKARLGIPLDPSEIIADPGLAAIGEGRYELRKASLARQRGVGATGLPR